MGFIHRVCAVIGLVMLAALIVGIVVIAADVLLVFFGGLLLAVFLRGLAELVNSWTRLPVRIALALILFAMAVLLGAGSWFLAAELSSQLDQLGSNLLQIGQRLEEHLRREVWGRQLLALLWQAGASADGGIAIRVAQIFSTSLGAAVNVFIVLFIGIYVAVNPNWYIQGLMQLIPPAGRHEAREILAAIGHTLRWWLFGRAVGMTVVGIATTLGLWWLDMPLALGLGLIAAALDFIPVIGPILAAVPAVVVAFGSNLTQATYVVMLYLAVQFLEGYVLTPLIEQRSVRLPPALTIGAQVLFGVLTGALGVVFATPFTAVLAVLIKRLYVEDTLERPGADHEQHA